MEVNVLVIFFSNLVNSCFRQALIEIDSLSVSRSNFVYLARNSARFAQNSVDLNRSVRLNHLEQNLVYPVLVLLFRTRLANRTSFLKPYLWCSDGLDWSLLSKILINRSKWTRKSKYRFRYKLKSPFCCRSSRSACLCKRCSRWLHSFLVEPNQQILSNLLFPAIPDCFQTRNNWTHFEYALCFPYSALKVSFGSEQVIFNENFVFFLKTSSFQHLFSTLYGTSIPDLFQNNEHTVLFNNRKNYACHFNYNYNYHNCQVHAKNSALAVETSKTAAQSNYY